MIITTPEERASEEATPELAVAMRGVTKAFDKDAGVFDLDLAVPAGIIFGIIGPSGSGKTTTVRLITGVLSPDSGEVSVLSKDPTHFDPEERGRVGYLPQLTVLYPELSLRQNLTFAAALFGLSGKERRRRIREVLELVELWTMRTRLLRNASGGMQRRLSLAATLVHDPDLIVLDEPTAGVDPVLRSKFWEHFRELRDQGRTLLVTTQYVGEAAYCDQIGVIADGRLLLVDTPEGLRRRALGGEALDVELSRVPTPDEIDRLSKAVKAEHWERTSGQRLRVFVDDAGTAAAEVASWAAGEGIELESVEPFQPSFDDVFVELVGQVGREQS